MTRKEILEQLAEGTITREEAEEQIAALGNPVPTSISRPPSASPKRSKKGCLIALIIAVLLGLLAIPIIVVLMRYNLARSNHMMEAREEAISEAIKQQLKDELPE